MDSHDVTTVEQRRHCSSRTTSHCTWSGCWLFLVKLSAFVDNMMLPKKRLDFLKARLWSPICPGLRFSDALNIQLVSSCVVSGIIWVIPDTNSIHSFYSSFAVYFFCALFLFLCSQTSIACGIDYFSHHLLPAALSFYFFSISPSYQAGQGCINTSSVAYLAFI